MDTRDGYLRALRFRALTPLYDALIRWTMPEDAFKRRLVGQADLAPGQRVLDLGCGTGTLTLLAKAVVPGAELVGIDPDADALEIARAKTLRAGLEIRFDRGSATALPYPDGGFDRALSSLVFHHLDPEGKRAAAREAYRVLRPGGALHVADWGRPHNPLMRAAFLGVQLVDGFATTAESVAGRLPGIFREAGFERVEERSRFMTAFGTLALYSAHKPGGAPAARGPERPGPEGRPAGEHP